MSFLNNLTNQAKDIATKMVGEEVAANADELYKHDSPVIAHVTCDVLNVRQTPSIEHPRIGTLKRGDAISVNGIADGWLSINYNNQNAFVAAEYTDYQKINLTVTASTLNVRQKPSMDGQVLGSLHQGDKVKVLGEVGGWVKFLYNNTTAYCSKQYLS